MGILKKVFVSCLIASLFVLSGCQKEEMQAGKKTDDCRTPRR